NRTPEQLALLADYYEAQVDAETAPLHFTLSTRESEQIMRVQVLAQRDAAVRTNYVFHRGDFLQPDTSQVVEPATPGALPGPSHPATPLDRLALARWLVQNPLTPRVRVNKIWATL